MLVVRHHHHHQRRQDRRSRGHRRRAELARGSAVLGPEMLEGRRLLAAAVAPQFEVRWNEAAVRLTAKNVRATQATNFGPVSLLQTASATLTIVNRGTVDLQLDGERPLRFQGKAAADFRIAALPETSVVPPGGRWPSRAGAPARGARSVISTRRSSTSSPSGAATAWPPVSTRVSWAAAAASSVRASPSPMRPSGSNL
jgi:hypothetical protein